MTRLGTRFRFPAGLSDSVMHTVSHPLPTDPRTPLWGAVAVALTLLLGMGAPSVAWAQSTPPIQPQASSVQQAGTTFWVEIQAGSEAIPVEDLFGISLALSYDTSRVNVVDDEAGPFLGGDVVYSSNVDAQAGEVGIGVSRKSGAEGVDGAGVVARVQIQVASDVPEGDTLAFRLADVSANGPQGGTIALAARDRQVTVGTAIPVQPAVTVLSGTTDDPAPGDTIAVDVQVGTDAVPVSDLFGTSFTLTYDPSAVTVLSDTAGAFLGSDLVYSSNLDAAAGELGVGVSRKAGAGGVSGSGSVARVRARVDPGVAEGTSLSFGLTGAQARNPADSSITLSASDAVLTANAIPAPPQGVMGTTAGADVALTWTAPSEPDLDRYRVYRDTAPIDSTAGPSSLAALDSTSAGTTTLTDSTVTPGTTYFYRVTAVDAQDAESGFSNEAQVKARAVPVATTDSARSVTDDSAVLYGSVDPNGDATTAQFRYYPSSRPAMADTVQAAESPVTGAQAVVVSASVQGLEVGTAYTYQTLAANNTGSRSGTERTFTTAFAAPTVRPDTATVRRGGTQTVAVLSNDEAGGGLDPSSVTIATRPEHGTANVNATTGTITYAHDGSENLSDSFSYTVADAQGQRSEPVTVQTRVFGVRVQGEASLAEGAQIAVSVEGDFSPSGRLYARRGGTTAYRQIPSTEPLAWQLPDSLVTRQGIDYYAVLAGMADTVTVPAGGVAQARQRPRHLPVQFDSLTAPVTVPDRSYRMVTVPVRPSSGTKAALEATYGSYDPQVWRLLRWDAEDGDYQEYPEIDSLRPGEAFWLITSEGEAPVFGAGQTAEAGKARRVPLNAGWNQVGSPFGYAVPWDTVQAASGLGPAEVDGPVAYRDSAYRRSVDELRAWRGYFVFSAEQDTLVVPPVGGSATGSSPTSDPAGLAGAGSFQTTPADEGQSEGEPYTIRIDAQEGDDQSSRVWLGLRPDAEDGRDHLDFAQAPPIGDEVRLSVPEQVAGRSVPHAGSFKPVAGDGQAWRLRLRNPTETAREVRVGVQSAGELPPGQSRYVLDLKAGRQMAPGQSLRMGSGEERMLKVIVGTRDYAESESGTVALGTFENELRGNAPNPFGGETRIAYTLAKGQEVTVEVYDVLGRRVRTLVKGKEQKAGLHRVQWVGENRYGEPVGSGVYFVRIRADGFTETQKMVLVR